MARRNEVPFRLTAEDRTQAAFRSVRRRFRTLSRETADLTRSFGVAAGVGGIGALLGGSVALDAQIGRLSRQIGTSSESFSELTGRARLLGIEADRVGEGVLELQNKLVDAAEGSDDAAASFRILGLNVNDLIEADPSAAFEQTGRALAELENQTLSNALADRIFSGEQRDLVNIFRGTDQDIATVTRALRDYNRVIDESSDQDELVLQFRVLREQFAGIVSVVGREVLPVLNRVLSVSTVVITELTSLFTGYRDLISETADTLAEGFSSAFQRIRELVRGDFQAFSEAFDLLSEGEIFEAFGRLRARASEEGSSLIVALTDSALDVGGAVATAAQNIGSTVVEGLLDESEAAFDRITDAIFDNVQDRGNELIGALRRIQDAGSGTTQGNPLEPLFESQSDIISGFREAIELRDELLNRGGSSGLLEGGAGALRAAQINATSDPAAEILGNLERSFREARVTEFLDKIVRLLERQQPGGAFT